jgi:hypothetical protein
MFHTFCEHLQTLLGMSKCQFPNYCYPIEWYFENWIIMIFLEICVLYSVLKKEAIDLRTASITKDIGQKPNPRGSLHQKNGLR